MKYIQLANSEKFAIVDDEDFDEISKRSWHINFHGYASYDSKKEGLLRRTKILMHRKVMNITDPNILIDHINGNKLDNRRSNLRIANRSQNAANGNKHKNNTSGYKGASFMNVPSRGLKQWVSTITVNRKRICIGYFLTAEEAARAYDKAAKEHFGEYAKLNFPEV